MKDVLKIVLFVIVLVRLLFLIPKLFNAANTKETTIELSPLVSSFTGKHFDDSTKQWYTNRNVILTSNRPDAGGRLLISMQIAKLEQGNTQKYALLYLTKYNKKDTANPYNKVLLMPKLDFFVMDGNQYSKLKLTIANSKKNLSITSKQHGASILPKVNEDGYNQVVENMARSLFVKKENNPYDNYGIGLPNTSEFIVTTETQGNNKVVRFLLPSSTEIQLNYFQKNYFEVPLEEFKEMLIN